MTRSPDSLIPSAEGRPSAVIADAIQKHKNYFGEFDIKDFQKVPDVNGKYRLSHTIDFRPLLEDELYGPLQDQSLFEQVRIDSEVSTLVWPNGADFDPVILHDWPEYEHAFKEMARQWTAVRSPTAP